MESVPPAPTFRAPTRDSVLRRMSPPTASEEDLSFMDAEIKRLHRDMANMLATAGQVPPTTQHVGSRPAHPSLPSIRAGPSDSDDDYSDDEPALNVLRDDLRSTTEKFFERESLAVQWRRASSVVAARETVQEAKPGLRHEQSWHQHQSWNSLADLEKDVGGMMRRPSVAMSSHQSRESAGSGGAGADAGGVGGFSGERFAGDSRSQELVGGASGDFEVGNGVHDIVGGSHDEFSAWQNNGGVAGDCNRADPRSAVTQSKPPRWQGVPSTRDTSCNSPPSGEQADGTPRRTSRESSALLKDLRARSEEATRTLEALKLLLVEERTPDGMQDGGSGSRQHHQQAGRLWPTRGEKTADLTAAVDVSPRIPQLLQAMENLQQINAELNGALRKLSSSGSNGSGGGGHSRGYRRAKSLSGITRRRQVSDRFSSAGILVRHPRSSSDLLSRRRSALGQAEPMSCGVPRHRVQMSKQGDDVVYFELAITQARSTWAVERRLEDFLELRRSLVVTATNLAEAAAESATTAAAAKRQRGPVTAWGDSFRLGRKASGSGGGKSLSVSDSTHEYRQVAEERVPELSIEKRSWFARTRLGFALSGRSREEILAEKQVLLASWLAKVLDDSALISPDLVRFLGGDSAAQPVMSDVVVGGVACAGGGREPEDNFFDSSDSLSDGRNEPADDSEEDSDDDYAEDDDDSDDYEDDDDADLTSELESLRGSICPPEEWSIARQNGGGHGSVSDGSPRDRLEKAMEKKSALARRNPTSGKQRQAREAEGAAKRGAARSAGGSGGGGEEDEDEDEDEEETQSPPHRPVFLEPFVPSSIVARRRFTENPSTRRPKMPSPSSPTVTLDAFFQAPT